MPAVDALRHRRRTSSVGDHTNHAANGGDRDDHVPAHDHSRPHSTYGPSRSHAHDPARLGHVQNQDHALNSDGDRGGRHVDRHVDRHVHPVDH